MDSKEDEEINIDFGRIKNFFKSDKKEEKKEEAKAESEGKAEDEITIDFSRLKGIFGDKPDKNVPEKKQEDDIELSFDFGKVKKFFKTDRKDADEVNINWGKIAGFFRQYGFVLIALIPIILSIYVRLQAGNLAFTDDWATSTVLNGVRSQIKSAIDQQYPNLPDANKNALVETEMQKMIAQNKRQIDDTIRAYSTSFKAFFQDDQGNKYMPDIDPYYWFRYAKNIVEHGHPGDILKDGKPFDTYQLAPLGRFVVPDMFHSYSLAYFYKFLHFFNPDLKLMQSMFYLPVVISALCVLLVFLIGRKIAGNIGGFFAGTIMAVTGAFLSRSIHPDNDIWVVFFPLMVTYIFVSTIESKSTLKDIALSIFAGLLTAMFTEAWSGWWYIFDFLLLTAALTFLYLGLTNIKQIARSLRFVFSDNALRGIIIFGVIYFISTALFTTWLSGWPQFRNSFLGPLSFPSIKAPVQATTLWPNVLTTVAELNEGSIDSIINSVGGKFLFYIGLLGLILAISRADGLKKFDFKYMIASALFYLVFFIKFGARAPLYQSLSIVTFLAFIMLPILLRIGISIYRKDPSYDFKLSILLALWVVSTIFASIKGIRFTLLLAPAFSVAFGVALGKTYLYTSKIMSKELKIHKAIGSSILILLILLVYINPIRGGVSIAKSDVPIVNDAWYNSLAAIKQDSKSDAIITSWWDFGHHFKALADRRVTFDGTTQTSEAAHWVGKLLMTDNELQAIGILRMLDCGANGAFNAIEEAKNDYHNSIRILNEVIVLDKSHAQARLRNLNFDEKQIEKILSLTHCSPVEAYFIASEDMIGKSGVWSHFGSWSFERADLWQNARRMPQEDAVQYMMKKFNYTRERAENTYFEMQSITTDSAANSWVAPWPGYGGTVGCSKNDKGLYTCGNGFQIDLAGYDVFATGPQGIVRPKTAVFTTKDGTLKKEFNGSTVDFGMTIIPRSQNNLEVVLSSRELSGSMFTRMFYMQGHSLRYFKLLSHQRGLTGTDIYVYKVDWEGKNMTKIREYADYLSPKPEERPNDDSTESSNSS